MKKYLRIRDVATNKISTVEVLEEIHPKSMKRGRKL